tara:strand:+ start:109 stop:606 length:498 start_codon:yes stop_codon:yes gene_type:complete
MYNLYSNNLKYEPISVKHCSDEYVSWLNDEDVNKYLESGGDYDLNKLKRYLMNHEKKQTFFWAIFIKNKNKHIGNIKIDPIDSKLKSGEYGIMIGDKSEWGNGYAYEASDFIIKYCFSKLELNQIKLGVIKENLHAVRLYKKLGFKICENVFENSDSYIMIKKNG